jgi:alkylhydroperoxidase family enzyme
MTFGAPSERVTDERTILAVGLAHAATQDPHSIHEGAWQELKEHFTERELVDLIFFIGYTSGMQMVNVLLDTDLPDEANGSGSSPATSS